MSKTTAVDKSTDINTDRNTDKVFSYKKYYSAKYVAGILFILSAAVLPLWLFVAICFVLFLLSFTSFFQKVASVFHLSNEKSRQFLIDTRRLTGLLAVCFLLSYFIGVWDLDFISFPSFLIVQALAMTIFCMRSWYSLFHSDSFCHEGCEKNRFKNLSLSLEFLLILIRVLAVFFSGLFAAHFTGYDLAADFVNHLLFISIVGVFIGSLIESLPLRFNEKMSNLFVFLSSLLSMGALYSIGFYTPWNEIVLAALFSILLAFLAYRFKIADASGLFSAAVLGVLIISFAQFWWFILLSAFFILGGVFTNYKFKQKEEAGVAESNSGRRCYKNVFSNSFWALVVAVLYGILNLHSEWSWLCMPLLLAYVGTVASATGDTMASEIGVTSKGATYMITSFRKAKPGEDGGVSLLGEIACLAGSFVIGLLAFVFGMIPSLPIAVLVAVAGGFFGTNIDSVFGALFQKRGWLSNSGVNFFSTFFGALVSFILYFLLF
ncbi:MAG: TIGR00297 family protein [Methanimicrococcus sp.]|nr:TIGR00297 family protein [Methanimicrococcus sp.]